MRLVEGVGGELLPVGPYLFQYLRVVAVLLAALNEFGLHGVDDILFLFTHRLTQGITLTTRKICQLAREQHHLLLIDGNAVGVLQIFLHAGNRVGDRFQTVLTLDEVGDVIHRSRTVEGIHGDEVLKHRGMQLAQVFLHTCRLKLEGADGAAFLVEFEGLGVVDGDVVEVDVDISRQLDIGTGLFQLRKGLQSQEVHLDESRRLNDVTVVLRTIGFGVLEVGVVGCRDRNPVGNRVATNDESAGVDTCTANGAFEHLRIFDAIA